MTAAATPLRVLVADDEATARKRLLRLLAAMEDVEIAGECGDAHEVLARVRGGQVDVVLLDIQMPRLDGFEVLELVGGEVGVIFVTAYDKYALKAFEVQAVDYLLKPIDGGRLRKALDRVRQRAAGPKAEPAASSAAPLDRLALPTRQGIVLLDPSTSRVIRVIALQYNPDTMTRTLQAQSIGDEPGDRLDDGAGQSEPTDPGYGGRR